MQDEEVRAFKNELRNYKNYLHKVCDLEESIDLVVYKLSGVHGIDPSKEPIHALPNQDVVWELYDKLSRLERKKEMYEGHLQEIDRILNLMEEFTRDALKLVYIEGKRTDVVADSMFISPSGLKNRMNRAIKKAIKKED